jgi:hypothetical protein
VCCPPCQVPCGLTLVQVTGCSTSPYRLPLHTKRNIGFGAVCDGRGREWVAFHASAAECTACTSLSKPDVSTAQAATLSSSKSALLPPNEHANGTKNTFSRYSEPVFWSHRGLNLAHVIIVTISGDMQVLTHRDASPCPRISGGEAFCRDSQMLRY